jgi:predicted transcriptional regulator
MSKNTLVAYLSYLSSAGIIKVEHNKRVLTELGKKLLKLKKEGKI